ncbi:hypothetical protein E5288_WYG007538 [Bos mutus]|uniref:Uncharacterized protein n=1 Tax=Bos mutus TaxID=72004 RepID=A0A6B0REL5_9CETA|nr:hypothetical protein [Bos mutus]
MVPTGPIICGARLPRMVSLSQLSHFSLEKMASIPVPLPLVGGRLEKPEGNRHPCFDPKSFSSLGFSNVATSSSQRTSSALLTLTSSLLGQEPMEAGSDKARVSVTASTEGPSVGSDVKTLQSLLLLLFLWLHSPFPPTELYSFFGGDHMSP